jgi:hypothetical protein
LIAPANLGEVSGVWQHLDFWHLDFWHLDFWFPVQFSGTSFFHQPDGICDLIDQIRPIEKKNPVADFQQQV